jgi:hypothetical protein
VQAGLRAFSHIQVLRKCCGNRVFAKGLLKADVSLNLFQDLSLDIDGSLFGTMDPETSSG